VSQPIRLPFGREYIEWLPPDDLQVTLVEKREPPALPDPLRSLEQALDAPDHSPSIEELAAGARSATIVVTDATRPCPDRILVPALLERLHRAGIPREGVTILVAIGMHRPSTPGEKEEKLGPDLVRQYRVVDSAPLDTAQQVDFGLTPDGVPVRVDRRAVEADLLLATGIVEPHQYAGFSGGWKTVAIGTASKETISALHGMRFLEDPGVRLALTDGNPFLEAARWIGEKAGLRFVVNVAIDSAGRVVAVRAGHPESVHRALAAWVREKAIVPVGGTWPIVIGAAGHPKDSNLYQATRIPTYLCFGRKPVVSEGGAILVPAACPEGAGQGPGEELFLKWLSGSGGPERVIERARREGIPAGGQRAVMVAWALRLARIAIVGSADPGVARACGLESFGLMAEAVEWARDLTGKNRVLVVPRALTTLPEAS
jgi:lactate racemase